MAASPPVLIHAEGLTKSFRSGDKPLEVLKGIDFTIQSGEMVAVCGASGVGKSTLLHILGTLEHPTAGRVLYEGIDVFSLNHNLLARFRNRVIGFVFQFHHLLPEFTAVENVMMPGLINGGAPHEVRQKAEMILSELGLTGRFNHRPGELSGGEQQRVAIARAIAKNPEVLLCDEPTGALDSATGVLVLEAIERVNRDLGTSTVLITHNAGIAAMADRVIQLHDGRISSVRENAEKTPAREITW